MSQPITVFLLDNVDSFTYNLVDELRTMELNIVVYRNNVDARMLFEKMQLQAESGPVLLLLSPGPGAPHEAGCMPELLSMVQGHFPVLGICLGHQAIGITRGMKLIESPLGPVHGVPSTVISNGEGLLKKGTHTMTRYNSLILTGEGEISVTSVDETETLPMEIRDGNTYGVQFHPESIGSVGGMEMLAEFLRRIAHS